MPALIDLAGLDASGLQLSEARREAGRGSFSAGELAVRPLSATLAVLSQADWRGRPESSHDNLPPLVADLLQAGSGAVLVSLWPRDDAGAAWFMERFYERLAVSGDAALALAQVQRTALTNESPARAWAGYSLYLR